MLKHGKQTTTRHSTTLIQSKPISFEPNKTILTRILLQYKWLKPQIEAFHLHHFHQNCKQFKVRNIKDVYINSLQSVNVIPQLLKKYYQLQEISKEVKKIITIRIKNHRFTPQIQSPIYKFIRQKCIRIIQQKDKLFFKQKVNPKLVNPPKEPILVIPKSKTKITFHTIQQKSPSNAKLKKSHQKNSKNNLDNTKIYGAEQKELKGDENYGLRFYHVKNKLSLHNVNSNQKYPQKVTPQNQYKQNYYFNYSRPKHKKTNSNATPQKSIQTSRKVSSKEILYLRSEKTKTENSKSKERLKFNKGNKY